MVYPGTAGSGSYGLGGTQDDPNSLESRKKQLIQKMLASGQQNQTGLTGTRAQPLFGGHSRGGNDHAAAAMPSISFNPFLAMAAGRPSEQFRLPDNITMQALQQAQAGPGPIMGGGAQTGQLGGNAAAAGAISTGAAAGAAGMGGAGSPGAASPAPMGFDQPIMNPGDPGSATYGNPMGSPRHLVGNAPGLNQVDPYTIARLGSPLRR